MIYYLSLTDQYYRDYDCMLSCLVRADSEQEARLIAADNAGDEKFRQYPNPWLDINRAKCEEISATGRTFMSRCS